MTLKHLRIFLAVCNTGKVTEAANQLYMTQPAVSLAIAELESHYGIKLFDRISRRLHITQQGEQLRQYASHIVALSDEVEQQMVSSDASGTLRIGGSITVASGLLPNLVADFQKQRQDMEIFVQINTSQNIEQAILQNKLDVGIIERTVSSPYLLTCPMISDELVFLCHPDHPFAHRTSVSIAELLAEPLLLRETGSGSRDMLSAQLEMLDLVATPHWESVSNTAILTATAHGLGVSYMPKQLAKRAVTSGKLAVFHVEHMKNTRQMTLIYHRHKFLSPALEQWIAHCKTVLS